MHDDRLLVEARLRRFTADHLIPALSRDARPLAATAWQVPDEPVPFDEAAGQRFEPVPAGWRWGAPWSTTWFRVTGEVPREWLTPEGEPPHGTRVEVLVDFGYNRSRSGFQAEGLAYRPDGTIVKSIAPLNSYVTWRPEDGPSIDLFLEAAANPDVAGEYSFAPTPLGDKATAGTEPLYELRQLEVALLDVEVWELVQDVWTLSGLMQELPPELPRRHEILRALENMLDALDPDDVAGSSGAGRAALAEVLARPAYASAHRVIATGHAHIDSAWLWPLRETVRKCARTFSNVMTLMDEHPDFVFACSSAQQFAWIQEFYPDVFARIREKVAAGQFVPVGGMWVESDTNMPGSEAMTRQFLAGKRFFLEELGVETREAWLPDSFGYSAALPQIVAGAGNEWFLTQKISWNQTNRMPHHTFWWEGIDGTRMFTHFPPADTYISELSGKELAHAERNFSEKGRATMSLVPFGWGDGGGGPTREMIAAAHRLRSLEGSPTVEIASPAEFFAEAQAEYPDAPVWSGEMYLELHRGVYTSQLRTKQGNRRSEALLREAEVWATAAAVRTGADYPYEVLERCWREVLLLQFHDILPGSSIAWVHREAEQKYARVAAELEQVIERALGALAGTGEQELTVNSTPHPDAGVASLAIAAASTQAPPVTATEVPEGWQLDNGSVRAVVAPQGWLLRLEDAATGRNAIAPGAPGNVLRLHRDLPNLWDAWDLDAHYKRTVTELTDIESSRLLGDDDRAVVEVTRRVGESSIVQRVALSRGAAAVEIETEADWREREKILKLAFPLDVHADRVAAETQYGHVFRATHTNTSWEAARFEACQHRWLHVGEPGYGVAVANDSTYGYDIERSTRPDGGTTTTVRFSLLRAPKFPDPESDQGRHVLRFAVAPGAGVAEAIRLGYRLNARERTVRGAAPVAPLVTSSNAAVIVEAVKLAEDRSGDVIVRLYESLGSRADAELAVGFPFGSAVRTDLLERRNGDELEVVDGRPRVRLRPFQIATIRFSRGPA